MSNCLDLDQPQHIVGPDLDTNCLQGLSADNKMIWVQTVCKGYQQTTKVGKELDTKIIVDTTFWLKPWLKLSSFGYNFFHLAKVLATTNSEPEVGLYNIWFIFIPVPVLMASPMGLKEGLKPWTRPAPQQWVQNALRLRP